MIPSYLGGKVRYITTVVLLCISTCIVNMRAVPEDYVVVFDVTSTFHVNQQTIRKEVPGIVNGVAYTLSKWTSKPAEAIENDFRNLLASLGKQQGPVELLVRDPEGRVVSELLSQWLSGAQSAMNLVQCIKNYAEYDIFKDIAQTIFNDRIIAKHTNVVPGMVACIEACAKVFGSRRLYLIGNWDPGSFVLLSRMSHAQPVFAHIPEENRLVSGLTRLLMPRNSELLFRRVAQNAQVSFDHVIFVSNMPYHLAAARNLGVYAVNFTGNNASEVIHAIANFVCAS